MFPELSDSAKRPKSLAGISHPMRTASRLFATAFEQGILSRVPESHVNGGRARRVANTSNITFPHAAGESLVIAFDLQGVQCSGGAACSSGAVLPSHVLRAIGLPHDEAKSTLRFSLGRLTTPEDIAYALEAIPAAVERLRRLSPNYGKATIPAD